MSELGVISMNEINSKYYLEKIYRIFEQLLNEFELIGKRIGGNPGILNVKLKEARECLRYF